MNMLKEEKKEWGGGNKRPKRGEERLEYMVFDLLKASYVKKNEDKSSKL
jgi:hypothetical protein